jgi:hypothetical protein
MIYLSSAGFRRTRQGTIIQIKSPLLTSVWPKFYHKDISSWKEGWEYSLQLAAMCFPNSTKSQVKRQNEQSMVATPVIPTLR